jgi:hypothetical protein
MARDHDPGPLVGVARGASTLQEVLNECEAAGFSSTFQALEGGQVRCLACRTATPGHALQPAGLSRLEGASDPADMLAVLALSCPSCGAHGTLVANFGPEATIADGAVLNELPDVPPPGNGVNG